MSKLNWMTKACGFFLLWAMGAVATPGQTFTSLVSLDYTNGFGPSGPLVQGTDGNLYGETGAGGPNDTCTGFYGCGTISKITPSGTLTSLFNFAGTNGQDPSGGLVLATDGTSYGTTAYGGEYEDGTVFEITPSGVQTTLYSFGFVQGGDTPVGGLVQASDGDLYGTTIYGGPHSFGTVFKITTSGVLTTIHYFDYSDGQGPEAALLQASNGNFYGTTEFGGDIGYDAGTIYEITPTGKFTTLYSFCSQGGESCTDGELPVGSLVQGTDGAFYGTAAEGGGTNSVCDGGCGTVFKITVGGTLTVLHDFAYTDGAYPVAGLVQGTDGNFYGTTEAGGDTGICFEPNGCGTIFKITPSGTLTSLHSFDLTDGKYPEAALVQDTNGSFYGTTNEGGDNSCEAPYGCGTVFSLSVGLKPFVKTQPASGAVGTAINILGTDLTGATSVTFNGTPAVFTVNSHSLITTTVPAGATTGTVQVVTPSGTLSSNLPFRVN
jgi:uncharacterized repeat protein (TIGR03803 family)